MATEKELRRERIHFRIRKRVHGTAERPRLSVFRSNKFVYVQLVNDDLGTTLAAADSRAINLESKVAEATAVGKAIAEKAKVLGIETCVFDRGGYLYHGRVKSIAEGAREGGLKF